MLAREQFLDGIEVLTVRSAVLRHKHLVCFAGIIQSNFICLCLLSSPEEINHDSPEHLVARPLPKAVG